MALRNGSKKGTEEQLLEKKLLEWLKEMTPRTASLWLKKDSFRLTCKEKKTSSFKSSGRHRLYPGRLAAGLLPSTGEMLNRSPVLIQTWG